MKVLYLFNKVIGDIVNDVNCGNGHDSWLFGMIRIRKYGIETDFLELEKIIPNRIARFFRKRILTMHYAHIPLFPLFYRYDLIFTSTAFGSLVIWAILKSFHIKVPKWVMLDFNILGTIQEEKQLRQKILAWAIEHVDGIVAISLAEADALKIRFPEIKDNIVFLHEPTDVEYFKPSDVNEEDFVLSVGNYGRDFQTIIRAMDNMGIKLKLATKLINKDDRSLPSFVEAGVFTHSQMQDLYTKAKLVVISLNTKDKYFDSVGTLSLGESLAMGKATIVSHTKSMESYVINNNNAVFVKLNDVNSMKEAISRIMHDNNFRRQLGKEAREYAISNLNSEIFSKKLADFLKRI